MDGTNGRGNRNTISIEICGNYQRSGNVGQPTAWYKQARANAEKLTGYLMHKYGWTEKDIYTHNDWNGKNCPRVIRREGYLPTFKKNAAAWKRKFAGETATTPDVPKPNAKVVTVNGTPRVSSVGGNKGTALKNFKGEINIEAPGAPYPYHIKGKGWVSAAAIGSQTAAKPDATIKVGSSVTVNGQVHANSAGAGAGRVLKNHKGKVTYTNIGSRYPYHIDGLGWVAASAIGATTAPKPTPKPTPAPKPTGFKVGDTVNVNGRVHANSAGARPGINIKRKGKITYTAPGAKFPYHIDQVGWVSAAAVGAATTSTKIKVGDMVLVKKGAKSYTGGNVISGWYTTPKVVSEISGNRVVLDIRGWATAFHMKDLKKV